MLLDERFVISVFVLNSTLEREVEEDDICFISLDIRDESTLDFVNVLLDNSTFERNVDGVDICFDSFNVRDESNFGLVDEMFVLLIFSFLMSLLTTEFVLLSVFFGSFDKGSVRFSPFLSLTTFLSTLCSLFFEDSLLAPFLFR